MLRNYFTITLRNFVKNRNYTIINILGLSVGIASCIVVFLLIHHELSFDKFNSKYHSIYRVVKDFKRSSDIQREAATPYPFAAAFRSDFPDIPLVTQMHFQYEVLLTKGDEKIKVKNVLFTDSLFFDVFDFNVLSGNPKHELGRPGKVFFTKSLADKVLKNDVTTTFNINNVEVELAGIVDDPPAASHISYSMIISMPSLTSDFIGGIPLDRWGMTARSFSYMVLSPLVTTESVHERLQSFVMKYHHPDEAPNTTYRLQPLKDIHFNSEYVKNPGPAVNVKPSSFIMTGILGVFILAIACINFINISTASTINKSKEVGIRKALGAKRAQLAMSFLGETFLLTLVSVLISLGVVELLLPFLNQFLEKQFELDLFSNLQLVLFLMCLVLLTTVLSGLYPSFVLSRFTPAVVLKNKRTHPGSSGASVRKALVVFQFLIAQMLIMGTLVIADQMKYFNSKPLGFDKEAVINVPLPTNKPQILESFRARLQGNANIQHVTVAVGAPVSDNDFYTDFFLSENGPEQGRFSTGIKFVDRHYLETYGIKLKAGKWFTETDEMQAAMSIPEQDQKFVYVINESAMRRLGFSNAEEILGKFITTGMNETKAEVAGVVEDFHVASLHNNIPPVVFMTVPYFYFEAGIKINRYDFTETIQFIKKNWLEVFPENYFEYKFLDEHLSALYRQEQRMFTLFKILAGISIFIGCLGLYGLISFMANQKVKEVSIRKVFGASAGSIVVLFSKEFVKLIAIAFAIAAPVAWYVMNNWLNGFAYRVSIHWSVFIIGILSALVIALVTVSYRSIRAAMSNPAETLRAE